MWKKVALAVSPLAFVGALAAVVALPAVAAEPSAKSAVAMKDLEAMSETNSYDTILAATIKVPNAKELIADVSLECGLMTQTKAKSKGGNVDSSTAEAVVRIRVVATNVDDGTVHWAGPDHGDAGDGGVIGVTFCKRTQTLSAKFQGIILNCIAEDGTISLNDACLEDEWVELILDTVNANAFNFTLPNLPVGTYTVEAQAEIDTCTGGRVVDADGIGSCVDGDADASAMGFIGLGSMVLDEVRFSNGSDGSSL